MCAFYYKETKASNIPPGTEVICAMYSTSLKHSLTHFPSWLSKQTFCKLLGFFFGTDMEGIVFHRNLLKPEDQFCSVTLLSPALSQTSRKHISFTGQNKNPT